MKHIILSKVYQHPLITSAEMKQIIDAHVLVTFKKGDVVLKETQQANEYYIIQRGVARTFVYDYDQNDITTDFVSDYQVMIEVLSLFQRTPSKENIQAVTDIECWKIDFEVFQRLFHSIKGFAEWGRLWLTNIVFDSKQRSVEMITVPAKERYLKLMKEQPKIVQNVPLKHIATYLGITDTSLSRIRKEISG